MERRKGTLCHKNAKSVFVATMENEKADQNCTAGSSNLSRMGCAYGSLHSVANYGILQINEFQSEALAGCF